MGSQQAAGDAPQHFRDLLLLHRGRTRLTQRELARRTGANRRTIQDWEAGVNYPNSDLLQALIRVLFEASAFTLGREQVEIHTLWASVQREAPRTHAPLDESWLAAVLAAHARTQRGPTLVDGHQPETPSLS